MQKFRMSQPRSQQIVEYLDGCITNLTRLAFSTGNTAQKCEILDVIAELVSFESSLTTSVQLTRLIRAFTLDWDRSVRSSAFRLLRTLCTPESEDVFSSLGIQKLAIIRLESSKAPQERVAVLRLIAKWLSTTNNPSIVDCFARALTGVVLAASNHLSTNPVDVYSTSFLVLISVSKRFPKLVLEHLGKILNSCHSRSESTIVSFLVEHIVSLCEGEKTCVQLCPAVLSPQILRLLCKSMTGLSIMRHSLTAIIVSENAALFGEIIQSKSSDIDSISLQAMLGTIPDVEAQLIHDAIKSMSDNSSTSSPEIDLLVLLLRPSTQGYLDKIAWRTPEWIYTRLCDSLNVQGPETVALPDFVPFPLMKPTIPKLPTSSVHLDFAHKQILTEILELISSVQFKTRSNRLTAKRQQTPSLFQSAHLWVAVYDYVLIGSFNLQARRVVHGLMVHSLCHLEDLDIIDSITS